MKTIESINNEIAQLKNELNNVEGKETEVYTRIVGYHRTVTNWNKGKKEEYKYRKTFNYDDKKKINKVTNQKKIKDENKKEEIITNTKINNYIFFYKTRCPNCPSVKRYMEKVSLKGLTVNVDENEGFNLARKHDVMSVPTVLFFNNNNELINSAQNTNQLKEIL